MNWPLAVSVLAAASACDRTPPPPPARAPLVVQVACGDEVVPVHVVDEVALDDAVCGEPWYAWQFNTARTVELVRRIEGRTVVLRRRGDAVSIDVHARGRLTTSYASPTQLQAAAPPRAQVDETLTLIRGAASEEVSLPTLRDRYPHAPGSGVGKEVSLCLLFGTAEPGAQAQIQGGPDEPPQVITRAACERDGMVLHVSKRGGIQLRDRTKRRYLNDISQIRLP